MDATLTGSLPLIVLLGALVLLAVFLAAAEAALLRVSPVRAEVLAEEGDRPAVRVRQLVTDLPRVLNAVLLVVLLTQIGAATVAAYLAERHFGSVGVTLVSVGLTLVMFVYAEAIPKTYAVRKPMAVARMVARPVAVIALVLRPIVTALIAFADLQAPGTGIPSPASMTEAELRRLAAHAADSGAIEVGDFELIERAFELGDQRIATIVVPRVRVVSVAADTTAAAALDVALACGHRRLPVVSGTIDDVTGVVLLRDLARVVAQGIPTTVADLQRPVLAVPETRRVVAVLRDMQQTRRHLAVAVDEHGGTTGIVTIEDMVEELVGRMSADPEPPDIRTVGPRHWIVAGDAEAEELAAVSGIDLPRGDWHTVSGLIMAVSGRIPAVEDEVDVAGLRIRVISATERTVRQVEVWMAPPESESAPP